TAFVQKQREHGKAHRADWEVDPEDKGPARMLDEKGAERWSADRRHAKDARQVALDPRSFGRGIDIADNRGGDRLDGVGAGPLQGEKEEQWTNPQSKAAKEQTRKKQAGAGKKPRFAAILIGQPAIDRNRPRLGQKKDGEPPAKEIKPAEIGDDSPA